MSAQVRGERERVLERQDTEVPVQVFAEGFDGLRLVLFF